MAIIVIIAVLFALGLYFKDKRIKENKSWLPSVLGALRFLSILGILFLLLLPLFKKFITEKQKPVVVILQDESGSIRSSTTSEALEQLETGKVNLSAQLSEKFEIVELAFGENLSTSAKDTIIPQSTNISSPLEYISETFEDQNLGAIILATDGIFNEGKNPLYADMNLAVPIYPIALGDTTIRKDILIKNVLHNRIAYLNDKFAVEVDVQAYNSKGNKSTVTLHKVSGSTKTKIDSKGFTIDKDNFFKSFKFELDADQVGNVKYLVSVNGVSNEVSTKNNYRNVYIEVLDARQKILLLANAAHPDIKAIKRTIKANKNYELEVKYAKDDLALIRQYDLIIMHDLPSTKHKVSGIIQEINKIKKPVFYINGASTSMAEHNSIQEVIKVTGGNQSMNDITPLLNDNFDLFTLDEELGGDLRKYVPLKVPFGEYKTQATAKVLLHQKIGNVETKYPLLAFSDLNNHKQAVLGGEGLWRWRLYEYQEFEEYKHSQNLIMKTLQYISQKDDKRKFRAFVSKNSFKENEAITFDAQLYNENYESINTPEAKLTIKNADGEKFDYTFSKTNNYYNIDAGRFPEGNYSFTATTTYNGKDLSAGGKFNVESIIKEQYDLTARHGLLHDLTKKFGGAVVLPDNISSIGSALLESETIKPILYQKAETSPVLDLWWLLALLIFFLAMEWFLRRYFGSY